METINKSQKRKKSGAENKKARKARRAENEKLGSFMKSYFTKSSKSSHGDDASSNDQDALNDGRDKKKESKDVKDGVENSTPDKPCDVDDKNDVEDEVEMVQDPVSLPEFDSGREVSKGNVRDDEMDVQESAMTGVATASEFDRDSSAEFNDSRFRDRITDFETGHPVLNEALKTSIPNRGEEDTIIIEQCMLRRNPAFVNDGGNETNDPALLVSTKFGIEDKEKLCKNEPCQPPESVLSQKKKKIGERNRYCSQAVFFHEDQTRRKWLSYSLSKDCLFCLPFLLFSDECLIKMRKHAPQPRKCFYECWQQEKTAILHRKREVVANRIVHLGKQGLAFRGHRESLIDDPEANKGNFLEALNYLSTYDITTASEINKLCREERAGKKETLISKGVSFGKLVAQTYDGASNMRGCYNSLQAIIKDKVGKHVAFVHCYAHTSDSASVDVQVISLFNDLEALYVLFSKTQRIHDLFEAVQLEENLKVLSLKRLNTVRWHSLELCLKVLLSRYDCILSILETVALDSLIDGTHEKRTLAYCRQKQIQTKQFLATAYLFREIFASTGPLSRYLQRVDVDFGKALGMVESPIEELNELRKQPERIISYVEQKHDSPSVNWQQPIIRRRRRMDDENAEDEPAETPEDHWKRNTFYVSVDTILNSLKNRCANELFNIARSFEKFDCSTVCQQEDDDDDDSEEDEDYDDDDGEDNDGYDDDDEDDDDEISSTSNNEQSDSGNQALRSSNLMSSHNIHRLGECFILCTEEDNCYGYNFRVRPSSIYTVNCQLSNSSVKINMTRMKNGPWVYYEDILVRMKIVKNA
ncbi:zinc finger MYM-type 1-like [Paramuricea clavata]|uniref:Zinc finger MYM-type 1-like n=1 Tax=Paramuricea clavata TaxID=317549 RepID=A0A6S7HZ88_PARCT|nr:zinc finger MYM-type 1-like [Paramuricea clavata]